MTVTCPKCAKRLTAPYEAAGRKARCSACQTVFEVPSYFSVITNSIGIKLVLIPPGKFLMGSPDSDQDAGDGEKPQHQVTITRPFYLGVYPVTQQEYQRAMGSNPSHFKGDPQRPVESVSCNDAVAFCRRLGKAEGKKYRLPTEAQWEYACRAGSTTKWCFGDSESQLRDYAWYLDGTDFTTHTVGQKKPNRWGLYDMHGNVCEWCSDRLPHRYDSSPASDPEGPSSGSLRVFRGGSYRSFASDCRSACGYGLSPEKWLIFLGFRVSLVLAH